MFIELCQEVLNNLCATLVDFLEKQTYNEHMESMIYEGWSERIRAFRMPAYSLLPDMGLYLEQTAQYVNHCLKPLGCVEITGSMIRNYVKMGLVSNPVRKQYFAEHIAHIMCIALMKHAVPLEHIGTLFAMQRKVYTDAVAYDYFCTELKNVLDCRFGLKEELENVGVTRSLEKEMLRSVITAVSHIIYVNACLGEVEEKRESVD